MKCITDSVETNVNTVNIVMPYIKNIEETDQERCVTVVATKTHNTSQANAMLRSFQVTININYTKE